MILWPMLDVGFEKAVLFSRCGIGGGIKDVRSGRGVVVVAPFCLQGLIELVGKGYMDNEAD